MKHRKRKAKGGNAPIVVEAGRKGTVEVIFKDADMARMAGISFNASRFIPSDIFERIKVRGHMDDLANELYCVIAEYWRSNKFSSYADFKGGEKERYKDIVRFVWRRLYRFLRDYIPEYKRKRYDKFMAPEKFNGVEDPGAGRRAYSAEKDLLKVVED